MKGKYPILFMLLLSLSTLACYIENLPVAISVTPAPTDARFQIKITPTPEATCAVTVKSLNVRSKPEGLDESHVIAWLYNGDSVAILESSHGWIYISAGDVTGWINSNYCRKEK